MTNTSGYLRTGTEVKILVGNHAGNIGKIIEVIHLSFAGFIYRVASSMEVGYLQEKCQYQYLEFLLTPEQVVDIAREVSTDWRHASWESVMNPPIDPQLRASFELREKLRVAQEVLAEMERKTEGPL